MERLRFVYIFYNFHKLGLFTLMLVVVNFCGGASLRTKFPENEPSKLSAIVERLNSGCLDEYAGKSRPVVVSVLGDSISVFDLQTGEKLWSRSGVKLDSAPSVYGDKIFFRSGKKIFAVSLFDGSKKWSRSFGQSSLFGFAFDGGRVFVSTGNTDGGSPATGRRGELIAFDADSGGRLWKLKAEKMFGTPTAYCGMVFLPWDRQAISVFDEKDGSEIFRFIRHDSMVDYLVADRNAGVIYYGASNDVQMLSKESSSGRKVKKFTFELKTNELPGNPRLCPDSYLSSSVEGGAKFRNKILWRPAGRSGSDGLEFENGKYYFLFYKYIIGFDAMENLPVWIYHSEGQISNSAIGKGGIYIAGGDGRLSFVDGNTGSEKTLWSSGEGFGAVFIFPFDIDPPQFERHNRDLHRDLVDMILDTDTQVLPLRKFGMNLLARMKDETVVMDLVQVMSMKQLPKALRDEAAKLLRIRKGGTQFLIEALKQHQDFLTDTPAPPSGAIATSLLHSGEKVAGQLILSHLLDHETPAGELAELSSAIVELGDETMVEELIGFLRMYHADSCFKAHPDVLSNVAKAIIKFGGRRGRRVVEEVANDRKSPSGLRFYLEQLLGGEGEK